MKPRDYDSTVARIAGNIAAGMVDAFSVADDYSGTVARKSVELARAIIAEVKRTEPPTAGG